MIRLCLLYLTLLLLITFPSTVSSYTSEAAGQSKGVVAKFGIEFTTEGFGNSIVPINLFYPGQSLEIPVTIQNTSDVTISYQISCKTLNALPLVITYVPTGDYTVAIHGVKGGVLKIEWPDSAKDAAYADEIDLLTVTLHYEQID